LKAQPYNMEQLATLRARLDAGVKAARGIIIGDGSPRIPTIGAVALPGASSASLLVQFDLAGIAVSAGSACSSGKMKESAVLAAMGVNPQVAAGFLRISFGPDTAEAEVDAFLGEWTRIASRSRAA
jgi:cysteine desulfurase